MVTHRNTHRLYTIITPRVHALSVKILLEYLSRWLLRYLRACTYACVDLYMYTLSNSCIPDSVTSLEQCTCMYFLCNTFNILLCRYCCTFPDLFCLLCCFSCTFGDMEHSYATENSGQDFTISSHILLCHPPADAPPFSVLCGSVSHPEWTLF